MQAGWPQSQAISVPFEPASLQKLTAIFLSGWWYTNAGLVGTLLRTLAGHLHPLDSIPIRGRAHISQCLSSDFENWLLPPAVRSSAISSFAFSGRSQNWRGSDPSPLNGATRYPIRQIYQRRDFDALHFLPIRWCYAPSLQLAPLASVCLRIGKIPPLPPMINN